MHMEKQNVCKKLGCSCKVIRQLLFNAVLSQLNSMHSAVFIV